MAKLDEEEHAEELARIEASLARLAGAARRAARGEVADEEQQPFEEQASWIERLEITLREIFAPEEFMQADELEFPPMPATSRASRGARPATAAARYRFRTRLRRRT